MDLPQILVTASVGVVASLVTAVITHLLTRAQERRKHERHVASRMAELTSADGSRVPIMAMQYAQACLIVELSGEEQRQRVFLPIGSRITIGRSLENHIRVDDPSVSRMHATFRAQGSASYVEPLAPTHGIEVNGRRVDQPKKLGVGDVITIPGSAVKITFVPLIS